MFRHFLVPLDGSRLAEAVLAPTRVLAARLGAAVTLFHVLERNPPAQVHGEPHLTGARAAGQYLAGHAAALEQSGIQVSWHVHEVAEGNVAQSITRHAGELETDLIMLATHGRGGMRDLVFGSIAQQVIGQGPTPVFIVHPDAAPPAFGCRQLVVPLDGATVHESSLPVAGELALAFTGRVHLVTVVPKRADLAGPGAAVGRFLPVATAAFLDVQERESQHYLGGLAARLQGTGVQATFRVERGDPTGGILQSLREQDADLLVVATHARAGWAAFWSGSVTPRLLGQWRRPTLLVRAAPS